MKSPLDNALDGSPAGRATRRDVARLAGVSDAVVSYVINGGPRSVATGTRERVVAAIEQLNYRPNASARALRRGRTDVIGLMVPDISNPFFSEFAKVVQERCYSRGYAVVVADTSAEAGRGGAQVRALLERQVDGVIDYGVQDAEGLSLLTEAHVPVVSMDSQVERPRVPTVAIDDYAASMDAVRHLAGHGHTRIGHVSGPREIPVSQARYRGWRDALVALSLPNDSSLVVNTPFSRVGGADGARELLSRANAPTAMFVASDLQGMGALYACSLLGLVVPGDVAMMSFDGTQETEFSIPPMSVVQQPVAELAKAAVEQLLDWAMTSPPVEQSSATRWFCAGRAVVMHPPERAQHSTTRAGANPLSRPYTDAREVRSAGVLSSASWR